MSDVFNLKTLYNTRSTQHRGAALLDGIEHAPRYERFADAAKRVIRCIHGIPRLTSSHLGEIEVYVGRSPAHPNGVWGRWETHYEEKDHRYGIVVLTCDTSNVGLWETAAVRAISTLKHKGRLCVKNIAPDGRGSTTSAEESCIYITWVQSRPVTITPPTRSDVEAAVQDAHAHLNSSSRYESPGLDSLRRAFDPISRPSHDHEALYWHYWRETHGP